MLRTITLYPDGAVSNNGQPGRMGFAVVAETKGLRKEFSAGEWAEYATNNRAELLGIILGLEKVKPTERGDAEVWIYTDSQWAVRSIRGEYQATANIDLLEKAKSLLAEFRGWELTWIRGHNGHPQNERANILAQREARRKDDAR